MVPLFAFLLMFYAGLYIAMRISLSTVQTLEEALKVVFLALYIDLVVFSLVGLSLLECHFDRQRYFFFKLYPVIMDCKDMSF